VEVFGVAGGALRVMSRDWLLGLLVVARDVGDWVKGCERGDAVEPDDGAERAGGIERVVGAERGAGADRAGADWRAGADAGRGVGAEARGAGDDALGAGADALGAGEDRALGAEDRPLDPPDLAPPRCAIAGTASRRRAAAIANRDRANMNPQRRCGRFAPATRIPEAAGFMWLRTRRLRASQRCVDVANAAIVSSSRHRRFASLVAPAADRNPSRPCERNQKRSECPTTRLSALVEPFRPKLPRASLFGELSGKGWPPRVHRCGGQAVAALE
jgi:hypothetical protein